MSIHVKNMKILQQRQKIVDSKSYTQNELIPTEKLCAYKSDMFSKASTLFFKENQEIRYTITDKF